jgi:hypothetical protein
MPIVFNRIYAYSKVNKVPMLPIDKRVEVGKLIAEAYHQAKVEIPLKRTRIKEDGNIYNVLYYPPIFSSQMDAIISKFYSENPVAPPKIRKRIPSKRPIASSKSYTR